MLGFQYSNSLKTDDVGEPLRVNVGKADKFMLI